MSGPKLVAMVAYMEHKNLANTTIGEQRARDIADGVHRVQERIALAEVAAGRQEGSVQLLAATKTRDVGEVMAAINAGIRLIGENRPQEVAAKVEGGLPDLCSQHGLVLGDWACDEDDIPSQQTVGFHVIGQLQSNKINKVIHCVDTIESVDTLELARKLAKRAQLYGVSTGVFLEVNESGEEAKSGCAPEVAEDLAFELAQLEGLRLKGLMTVGAHVEDERIIRTGFAHLRDLRDRILSSRQLGTAECTQLSMGMTQDMEYAIAEGSTEVRVGTAIFGERAFI